MKVKIAIQDRGKMKEAEDLGIEIDPVITYTDFWFKDALLESFWVDEVDNEIVFSIGGDDYRTPYTDTKFSKFMDII